MSLHPQLHNSSPFSQSTKRSLSYNDLKRKRLIRSEKSKSKLQPQHSQKIIPHTDKKKPQSTNPLPNTAQDIKKIQRSINQLKDVFDSIQQKTHPKKYIISKPFYTDRLRPDHDDQRKISFIDKPTANPKAILFYDSVEMAGNEKELIKQIISKKKSQRRLLKFDQIRAEVKRSKSKSKLNIAEEQTAPHSKINHSSSQDIMERSRSIKNIRVNKFQTVQEKALHLNIKTTDNNQQTLANNYMTSNITYKQTSELGSKSQYRSRRKLRIDDFKTDRKDIELTKEGRKSSEGKIKLHRKLRKTNSQIVIKTLEVPYNKSKYMSRVESRSALNVKKSSQRQENPTTSKSQRVERSEQNQQSPSRMQVQQKQALLVQIPKGTFCIESQQNDDQINILKDLELSAINISEIEIKKEQSFGEISNEISLINAIEAQELELQMKATSQLMKDLQQSGELYKKSKENFKKCKKQTPHKLTCGKKENAENIENIENLSNLLDFVSLPTEELKVKMKRWSGKLKKKNEMEKFKKIFPANFFNK